MCLLIHVVKDILCDTIYLPCTRMTNHLSTITFGMFFAFMTRLSLPYRLSCLPARFLQRFTLLHVY